MRLNAERDKEIVALATKPGSTLTYEQIAAQFGVSKGTISGVMFRHNKPHLRHTSRPPNPKSTPLEKPLKAPYAGAGR